MNRYFSFILVTLLLWSCTNEAVDQIPEEQACDNGTFVGRVFLTTQQEVNDFGDLCYTKIDGAMTLNDLSSTDDKIVDLLPLTNLIEIYTETYPDSLHGSLGILTSELTNLQGLINLESVGSLVIKNNESLISLNGLESLNIIGSEASLFFDDLFIENNSNLQNIDGLNNLTQIGTDGQYSRLLIRGNPLLQHIDGLESLSKIGTSTSPQDISSLRIVFNNQLQNVNGLASLSEVYGDLDFLSIPSDIIGPEPDPIYGNENLLDFCGLQNLLSNCIYGNVRTNHPNFSGYGPTVQDIIDGNCSQ